MECTVDYPSPPAAIEAIYNVTSTSAYTTEDYYDEFLCVRATRRCIKRGSGPLGAPANGMDTRIESRKMHSREPLRIPRSELQLNELQFASASIPCHSDPRNYICPLATILARRCALYA